MKLVAIVLAAGHARRFGGGKLTALFEGEPLVVHALRAARAAPVARTILVTRADLVIPSVAAPEETIQVDNEALAESLRAGIAAAQGYDGAFVFLGDMPRVPHYLAAQLADALAENYAALPVCDGRQGHPVLFAARAFPDVLSLNGDNGAGALLAARDDIARVPIDDPGVLFDVDRPEDLAR